MVHGSRSFRCLVGLQEMGKVPIGTLEVGITPKQPNSESTMNKLGRICDHMFVRTRRERGRIINLL
jgi:hypothetical protein